MATNLAKFGLLFYADTKNAERGMSRLSKQVGGMQASLMSMSGTMSGTFQKLKGTLTGLGASLVGTAARLETSRAQLQFAFRDDKLIQKGIFEQVEKAGLISIATTDELVNSVSTLKQMTGANVFDASITSALKSVNPEMTTFVELMDDMAAASPRGMHTVTMGLSAMLGGQTGRAGMLLDAIKPKMDQFKKAMKGAKTETEKLAAITPLLQKQYGGAGHAQANTWKFVTAQLDDIKDKLLGTFGAPLMNSLKGPVKEFQAYFTDTKTGILYQDGKLEGIKNVFTDIGSAIGRAARFIGPLAKNMAEFVLTHPGVVKVAIAVTAVVAGITGLGAALIAAKLGVIALQFAFSGLLTTMLPLTVAFAAFGVAAVYLTKWIVGGKSMADTWGRVVLIFTGLYEMMTSMTGESASLSEKTYKALADKGLIGIVVKLSKVVYRFKRLFAGVADGFAANWKFIKQAFEPIAARLSKWFGTAGKSADTSASKWHTAGVMIANVLTVVVKMVAVAVAKFLALLEVLKDVGSWMFSNKKTVLALAGAFGAFKVGGMASGALTAAGAAGSGLTAFGKVAQSAAGKLQGFGAAVGLGIIAIKGIESYYNNQLDKKIKREMGIASILTRSTDFHRKSSQGFGKGGMADLRESALTGNLTNQMGIRTGTVATNALESGLLDKGSTKMNLSQIKKLAALSDLSGADHKGNPMQRIYAEKLDKLVETIELSAKAQQKYRDNMFEQGKNFRVDLFVDGEKLGARTEVSEDRGGQGPLWNGG